MCAMKVYALSALSLFLFINSDNIGIKCYIDTDLASAILILLHTNFLNYA